MDFFIPDNIYLNECFLIICSITSYPFMLANNLHNIRYVCYIGFITILILLTCILYRAYQLNIYDLFNSDSLLWPSSILSIAHAVPIISFVFICQLNSLAIYSQLRHPSPKRMNTIVYTSIAIITFIFLLFSFTGVLILHASSTITDNILLVFPIHDSLMLLGRVNLLITLICSLPILIVPARHLILDLFLGIRKSPSMILNDKISVESDKSLSKLRSHEAETKGDITLPFSPLDLRLNAIPEDIETPPSSAAGNAMLLGYHEDVDLGVQGIEDTWRDYVVPSPISMYTQTPESTMEYHSEASYPEGLKVSKSSTKHNALSTGVLMVVALMTAILVPRVQVVWGLVGSSVTIIIAFLTPSACYLALLKAYRLNFDFYAIHSFAMIIISLALIGVCNYVYFKDLQSF